MKATSTFLRPIKIWISFMLFLNWTTYAHKKPRLKSGGTKEIPQNLGAGQWFHHIRSPQYLTNPIIEIFNVILILLENLGNQEILTRLNELLKVHRSTIPMHVYRMLAYYR